MSEVSIYEPIARALAALVLATKSYTILDRLANAIAPDAVNKGVYELSRGIDVILRNPKKGQEIKEEKDKIIVEIELDGVKNVEIYGRLPTAENYREFLVTATKDIRVARRTAAYAAALVASKLSDIKRGGG